MRPTNAITCCKYAGSVRGTFVFSMLLIHFDKEIAFRQRGVTAMCATHQFLQWIVTTLDATRDCSQDLPWMVLRNAPQNASWDVPMGAAVAALHLHVENGVWWYWPSKTQCILKILGKEMDSVAEWWRSCTPNNSFYNDICGWWVRCVKTISFYNDLCVSKHPCFIVVFLRAQRIVFYYIFGYIWSHKHQI